MVISKSFLSKHQLFFN